MTKNRLDEKELKKLTKGTMWKKTEILDKVDSTNTYLKKTKNITGGMAVFARSQTGGRGRRGKNWVSDTEGNIYLSVSFLINFPIENAPLAGFAAAVAVAVAIREFFGINCGIKWPNDIVAENKKLCGILCELTRSESGEYYAICGIGINIADAPDLTEIPTVYIEKLYEKEYNINRFAALLLKKLEFEYSNINDVISRYKKECITVGREVKIIAGSEFTAVAEDVEKDGCLIVRKNGEKIKINSGEVSVRGIYNYC